jgi:tRNA(Ile)-lysidine synthase
MKMETKAHGPSDVQVLTLRMAEDLLGPCMVAEGTPIVAACSGGADSCALVAGLTRLSDRWPLSSVVFVDHGLRDSRIEALAAKNMAERAGLTLTVRRLELPASGNLQSEARLARYRALHEVAGNDAVIATGHTMTDQAETVLQRLTRGAGLRGLAGIRPREGALVRPMLRISREETRALRLPFVDDPSNESDAYQRNRIRHHVLPLLREENPKVDAAIALTATQAQGELALIDAILEQVDHQAVPLDGLDVETLSHWLRWRLADEANASRPPSRAAVRALAVRVAEGLHNGQFSLGGGVQAHLAHASVVFDASKDPRDCLVVNGPGTYSFRHVVLKVEDGDNLSTPRLNATPVLWEEVMAPELITWPITLRALGPDTSLRLLNQSDVIVGTDGTRWCLLDGAGRSFSNGHAQANAGGRAIHIRLSLATSQKT